MRKELLSTLEDAMAKWDQDTFAILCQINTILQEIKSLSAKKPRDRSGYLLQKWGYLLEMVHENPGKTAPQLAVLLGRKKTYGASIRSALEEFARDGVVRAEMNGKQGWVRWYPGPKYRMQRNEKTVVTDAR